jgi:hypothetical protein
MARQTKTRSAWHISAVPVKLQLVKFSRAHLLFKMAQAILIAYIVCVSIGLVLSVTLVYRHVRPQRTNEMDGIPRANRAWERALAAVFDLAQAALLVNTITAVTMAITSTTRFDWVDVSIPSTLQLAVGTNVRTPIGARRLAKS